MLTKTEIKQCLLQLQQELVSFAPLIDSHLAIIQEKDQAIQKRHQQISVQQYCLEKEGYELKVPLYSLYISYLQALRDLGFLVLQVRDYNHRLQAIIQAIQRFVRRINRFFPHEEVAAKTREEFSSIAMECERTQFGLGEVVGILTQEMNVLASRYVNNKHFKAGIDAEMISLEASVREPLLEWCKPWVEAFLHTLPPETNVLDAALATLQPSVHVSSTPVYC